MTTGWIIALSILGVIVVIGLIRVMIAKPSNVGEFFLEIFLLDILIEVIVAFLD